MLHANSRYSSLSKDSRREERKDGKVRAGDEASIGDAEAGHEKVKAVWTSSRHDLLS